MRRYGIGLLLGVVLVIPVVTLISLFHELVGHAHLPVELLHSSLGLVVTDAVLFAEQAVVMVPYFLWGVMLSVVAYVRWSRREGAAGWGQAVKIGLLFGLPLILIVMALLETWGLRVFAILLLSFLFVCWGWAYVYVYNQLTAIMSSSEEQKRVLQAFMDRRQFLVGVAGTAASLALVTGGISRWLHLGRRSVLAAKVKLPDTHPSTLKAEVYSTRAAFQFPEQQFARYQPSQHPIGICFSGGGPRSASAALGQMRGLHALGLIDSIGAISCVSGGSWLSTLFTYAPTDIDDATLLGTVVEPEKITIKGLAEINPHTILAPLTVMTDDKMLAEARHILRTITFSETASFNRFYSRLLNDMLLKPFRLDDPHTSFTLDQEAVRRIIERNPNLTPENFYTARPNRPYLICSATHVYPVGENQKLRTFEYSPLYSGMPQFFEGEGFQGADLGGGYIESFAFDSLTPLDVDSTGVLTLSTPEPLFLLSDMIASTSAAPGMTLNHYDVPELMPQFKLWPLEGQTNASPFTYSIIDGVNLENFGIIPLLRRQYPIILVFVNSAFSLGSTLPVAINGVDDGVGRLFGFMPDLPLFNTQNTQVFPSEQFDPLVAGLKAAREKGEMPIYVDSYEIVQPNPFDIPSYPGDGKVTVVWFYNELNENWLNKLSPEVQSLLKSTDPTNRMDNFPFFASPVQNQTDDGVPQLLYYSPEQINLLAHMWCYNIMHDAKEILLSLNKV